MAVNPNNADSIKAFYEGYKGWNDKAAIIADFKATNGQGKGPSQGGGNQPSDQPVNNNLGLMQQALDLQRQSVDPIVSSLAAQRALIPGQTASQRSNLENTSSTLQKRYDLLLADLAGRQKADTESATLVTANELGRRGILPGSSFGERQLQGAVQPINQFYAGQSASAGLERESAMLGLANQVNALPSQEAQRMADLDLAIAHAKSGNSSKAVEILMSMQQAQTQSDQFNASREQSASQFGASQAQDASQYSSTLAENKRQFNTTNARSASSTNKAKEITAARNDLLSKAKSGWTLSDLSAQFGSILGVDDIVKLYSSVSPYGQPNEPWAQEILGIYNAPKDPGTGTGLPRTSFNQAFSGRA